MPDAVRPALTVRGLGEFVAERYPFAVAPVVAALAAAGGADARGEAAIDALRTPFREQLQSRLRAMTPADLGDTTPGVSASSRFEAAATELLDACDGFLRRAALRASLTDAERLEILRGMILTRATDNRLKTFFTSGEVRYGDAPFQGKGFRSLGQEAIYGAAIRLRRGDTYRDGDEWRGDVIAPLIRDLGATLAMRPGAGTIRMVLSAQMAKAGPPMDGKDLHLGDLAYGVLPASAPLGTGALTLSGMAMAFARDRSGRVVVSLIGEGGTSLGEYHEAINLCSARRLPAIFCIQNNQTALSTPVRDQSAVRVFADKAAGYGIPGITLDGTDPDEIAAAFTWAAERARAGLGPTLIELVSMRMCGHAHHDDMLYLGKDFAGSWDYPTPSEQGYVNRDLWAYWATRDPIPAYAARLEADGVIGGEDVARFKREAEALVESQARLVAEAPWPEAEHAAEGVFTDQPPRRRIEVMEPAWRQAVACDPDSARRRSRAAVRSQGQHVSGRR